MLGVLLLGWLLVPPVVKSWLKISFFEMQAPSMAAVSHVRDVQDYWAMRTKGKNELIEAARDLARLNAAYEVRLHAEGMLRSEIERLEQLFNLQPYPEFHYETARVARRDINGWWQRVVIRKGSIHGIREGLPVIFVGGVAGRVREVYTHTAVVDLVSSPTVRLSAVLAGDERPVSYQGGLNPAFRPPSGRVEFVPTDLRVSEESPGVLLTSGLGGVFPPGLRIGEVPELAPGDEGLFQAGRVRLDPRLNSLKEVTVLIPLREPES